jgi:Mucin-2 protein WxxW repeating region
MHISNRLYLYALSAAGGVALLFMTPGVASAGGPTPWFDRDNPSGVGDYEDTVNLLKVECQLTDGTPITFDANGTGTGTWVGYHCKSPTGGWCVNAETSGGNSCKDMHVRYSWTLGGGAGSPTPWFDRDDPSGVGDYEDTIHLLKIECQLTNGSALPSEPGYHCTLPTGGWCNNLEQRRAGKDRCQDMHVRYSW